MDQLSQEKDALIDELASAPAEPASSSDEVGELAIDVYDDPEQIVVKAPMAGVDPKDLELSITDETLTIRGKRHADHEVKKGGYLLQECYWGSFERVYTMPVPVDSERSRAHLKHGMLTISIPKSSKTKTRMIEVKTE